MKGGRKHLKRAAEEVNFTLQDSQIITQVVSLRGSNIIEVMDAQGGKSLAYFPAKFQKSMWIKRGSFVVVDTTGKKEAVEFGSKVTCMVTQVLFFEQIRKLKKSPEWPELFKTAIVDDGTEDLASNHLVQSEEIQGEPKLEANEGKAQLREEKYDDDDDDDDDDEEEEEESSDDDGLPPLEANTNRVRPSEMQPYSDSSGSDSDA